LEAVPSVALPMPPGHAGERLTAHPLARRRQAMVMRVLKADPVSEPSAAPTSRHLTAVLFVDMVDATPLTVALGDHGWAELLEEYHELARTAVVNHRGLLMDTAGDGFFAIFDEVTDAIGCALDIRSSLRRLELELRAGVHVGHCWNANDKCAGADVHLGARLAGIAEPGELLLSEAASERARRAGVSTTDRGVRSLKGFTEMWRVFAVGRDP